MATAFISSPPPSVQRRPLTENDAVDIWIARWLKVWRRDFIQRYGCDPRQLYEIWQEDRIPGSRDEALEVFRARFPGSRRRMILDLTSGDF